MVSVELMEISFRVNFRKIKKRDELRQNEIVMDSVTLYNYFVKVKKTSKNNNELFVYRGGLFT